MPPATISLVDRAGLDRPRLAKIVSRGLDGADDGELFSNIASPKFWRSTTAG